jgi:hypothetical protein
MACLPGANSLTSATAQAQGRIAGNLLGGVRSGPEREIRRSIRREPRTASKRNRPRGLRGTEACTSDSMRPTPCPQSGPRRFDQVGAGRSSGSRVASPHESLGSHPSAAPSRRVTHPNSGTRAAVVTGYSGASAADSHGLPCWALAGACNDRQSTRRRTALSRKFLPFAAKHGKKPSAASDRTWPRQRRR